MISKWNTGRGNVEIVGANDRQKSGSPLVNSSMTFIDGHLAAEILARRNEGSGVRQRQPRRRSLI